MNVSVWLKKSIDQLVSVDISTARLDCLVLLEDATGKDRAWLLAHPEFELTNEQGNKLQSNLERRAQHEPLAYIRGKKKFFGREFIVNEHTLEPRPETETMIELLQKLVDSTPLTVDSKTTVADVGTGSGCIAITSKLEIPELEVIASDIDAKCIETARKNAKKLNANITFLQGNLLQPIPISSFQFLIFVLANLPYVPDKYQLNEAAKYEPKRAIFGGKDGLDLYRELFTQLSSTKYGVQSTKLVLTESLPFQHKELASIAKLAGYKLAKTEDFIQVFSKD